MSDYENKKKGNPFLLILIFSLISLLSATAVAYLLLGKGGQDSGKINELSVEDAKILMAKGLLFEDKKEQAIDILNEILKDNPLNQKAKKLLDDIINNKNNTNYLDDLKDLINLKLATSKDQKSILENSLDKTKDEKEKNGINDKIKDIDKATKTLSSALEKIDSYKITNNQDYNNVSGQGVANGIDSSKPNQKDNSNKTSTKTDQFTDTLDKAIGSLNNVLSNIKNENNNLDDKKTTDNTTQKTIGDREKNTKNLLDTLDEVKGLDLKLDDGYLKLIAQNTAQNLDANNPDSNNPKNKDNAIASNDTNNSDNKNDNNVKNDTGNNKDNLDKKVNTLGNPDREKSDNEYGLSQKELDKINNENNNDKKDLQDSPQLEPALQDKNTDSPDAKLSSEKLNSDKENKEDKTDNSLKDKTSPKPSDSNLEDNSKADNTDKGSADNTNKQNADKENADKQNIDKQNADKKDSQDNKVNLDEKPSEIIDNTAKQDKSNSQNPNDGSEINDKADITPKDRLLYVDGVKSLLAGNLDDAIDKLKQAIELNGGDSLYYYALGNALFDKEKYSEAIDAYKKSYSIDPSRKQAYFNSGLSYERLKDYNNAKKEFNSSLSKDLTYVRPIVRIAEADYIQKNIPQATSGFEKALSLEQNNTRALRGLGKIYHDDNQLDKSEQYFKKALDIDSNDYISEYNLGEIYYKRKSYDTSFKYTAQAYTKNQKDPLINHLMGKLMTDFKNNPKGASAFLEAAFTLDKQNLDIRLDLSTNYNDLGLYDKAVGILMDIKEPKAYKNLAFAYSKKQDYTNAIKFATELIKTDTDKANYFDRGMLYLNTKNYKLAVLDFETVAKGDANYPKINEKLGLCYYYLGNKPKAKTYLGNENKLDPSNKVVSDLLNNL